MKCTLFFKISAQIIVSVALFQIIPGFAGTAYGQSIQTGFNFSAGLPQGEFNDHVENTGFGGSGFIGYAFGNSPVMIGMDIGFLIYGRETRSELLSPAIPDVPVDVRTSNNILMCHSFLRVQAERSTVQPYMDALIGFKYFFTRTSILGNWSNSGEVVGSTNLDDFALSYGCGGGLRFRVFENINLFAENRSGLAEILIDTRFRYLFGTEAEYLKKNGITRFNDGTMEYDVHKSGTDLLTFLVGVTFKFKI